MSVEKTKSFSDISDGTKEMESKKKNAESEDSSKERTRTTYEKFKQAITPDRNFLPLKMTW